MYEIHAFTKDIPFREFSTSEISDETLFQKLLEERFNVLAGGRSIYCTAVSPDIENGIEWNPHDYRDGTVHFVAIGDEGDIICGLSTAVDTGEMDRGDIIGLPLENRWKPNGYPAGASLDPFREKYMKSCGEDRKLNPQEMAELYRHFIASSENGNMTPRLGVYTGVYHLLVREPRKKGGTSTGIWVFDAIAPYFNLYRWAGAAVLRDPTLEDSPRLISPNKRNLKIRGTNGKRAIYYKDEIVSRNVSVPSPERDGKLSFSTKDFPFLDGVINIPEMEKLIRREPIGFFPETCEGFDINDKTMLRAGLATMGRRALQNNPHNGITDRMKGKMSGLVDRIARRATSSGTWEFNEIGDLEGLEGGRIRADEIVREGGLRDLDKEILKGVPDEDLERLGREIYVHDL